MWECLLQWDYVIKYFIKWHDKEEQEATNETVHRDSNLLAKLGTREGLKPAPVNHTDYEETAGR